MLDCLRVVGVGVVHVVSLLGSFWGVNTAKLRRWFKKTNKHDFVPVQNASGGDFYAGGYRYFKRLHQI